MHKKDNIQAMTR